MKINLLLNCWIILTAAFTSTAQTSEEVKPAMPHKRGRRFFATRL